MAPNFTNFASLSRNEKSVWEVATCESTKKNTAIDYIGYM
jgi:hypothetical protein